MTDFQPLDPRVRISTGKDGAINVRLSIAFLEQTLGALRADRRFAARYDKDREVLILEPSDNGVVSMNSHGKKWAGGDALSYYYRDDYLGFSHFGYFGRQHIKPVGYRVNRSNCLELQLPLASTLAAQAPKLAIVKKPSKVVVPVAKKPILLHEATRRQLLERMLELEND